MALIQTLKISDYHKICRLCLRNGSNFNKLIPIETESFINLIFNFTGIQVKLFFNLYNLLHK